MNKNLKLHFTKQAVNFAVKIAVRLIPKPRKVVTPQTKMLLQLKERMLRAYRFEVETGVFKEQDGRLTDGNFERILQLIDLLAYISEEDRYYRMYVGYLFVECKRIYEATTFTPAQVKHEIKTQWLTNIDFLNETHFKMSPDAFKENVLTDHLANY